MIATAAVAARPLLPLASSLCWRRACALPVQCCSSAVASAASTSAAAAGPNTGAAAGTPAAGGAGSSPPVNRVPPEKLDYVFHEFEKFLPRFFTHTHPYQLYTNDVVFEDNIRGIIVKGKPAYVTNLALLKIKAALLYASIRMNILKMTKHPEDGTIRVRWQTEGVSGMRLLFTFWRYSAFRKNSKPGLADNIDGFSIFYLNNEGLVYKHFCDKMIPDSSGRPVEVDKNMAKTLPI